MSMENLIKKAKDVFGTSRSCKLSTFLLPEGEVLNSNKYFSQDPNFHLHDKVIDKVKYNLGTVRFMNQTGAIRYHSTKNNINLSIDITHPITKKQMEFLEECSCFRKEKPIIYDFYKGEKFVGHNWTGNEPDCFKGVDKIKKQANDLRNNPKLLMIMEEKRYYEKEDDNEKTE